MERLNRQDLPEDDLVPLADLSLKSLIALVQRLQETETSDQFLYRELELDQAYFWADESFKLAKRPGAKDDLAQVEQIRALVLNAHDYVGVSNVHAAIGELNKVIELKMGL
jgi:hypothetical protein